jgi:hypothetical protein
MRLPVAVVLTAYLEIIAIAMIRAMRVTAARHLLF